MGNVVKLNNKSFRKEKNIYSPGRRYFCAFSQRRIFRAASVTLISYAVIVFKKIYIYTHK